MDRIELTPEDEYSIKLANALGSERRYRILKLLKEENGELNLTEIARKLGSNSGTIFPNINLLVKCGLLNDEHRRSESSGRIARYFSLAYEEFTINFDF